MYKIEHSEYHQPFIIIVFIDEAVIIIRIALSGWKKNGNLHRNSVPALFLGQIQKNTFFQLCTLKIVAASPRGNQGNLWIWSFVQIRKIAVLPNSHPPMVITLFVTPTLLDISNVIVTFVGEDL